MRQRVPLDPLFLRGVLQREDHSALHVSPTHERGLREVRNGDGDQLDDVRVAQ